MPPHDWHRPDAARRLPLLGAALAALAAAGAAAATDPKPEVQRPPAEPQPVGAAHTLRTIPEACLRLEGRFTGDPGKPYRFESARTSPDCQARARVVDADKARPDAADGWILNDRIRVPQAGCPGLQATVTVWRHPGGAKPPALDAQGRSRIYLKDSLRKACAGRLSALPAYAIATGVEGTPCR